ncbi:thioesterase II family protein [Streptomyces sp. NPDC002817]|uniref:thioesterase II family protein n=1 Tax=Streptomyces sp. NPDC088357 TaxID=3154655 RepID=UPI00342E7F8D
MTKLDDGLWFRHFHASADQGARLLCFPHSGGSATYFYRLSAILAPSVEVVGVQYPGRQDRRAEPLVDDLTELAGMIRQALITLDKRPLAFFGHSLGSVLAYEVCRQLAEDPAAPFPVTLLASGRRAPSIASRANLHQQGDDVLIAEIRRLSGTDASLLADEEVVRMVLPALRADYKAIETYQHRPGPPLKCSISVFMGDADPGLSADQAETWRHLTSADFRRRVFAGGHFYLNDNWPAVAAAITEDLASVGLGPGAAIDVEGTPAR